MTNENESWLNTAKQVASKFIESNYPDEVSLFDTFWQAFSFQFNRFSKGVSFDQLTPNLTKQALSNISFADDNSLDLMTPIILGTITETTYVLKNKKVSTSELEQIIGSAAARQGAKPNLTACLIKNLPSLFNDLMSCKQNAAEAIIRTAPKPLYKIWTKGKVFTAENMDGYEKIKDSFLFWIDLDAKSHISSLDKKSRISKEAIGLLIYLVEKIETPIPATEVLRDVFDDDTNKVDETQKNKVEQQITKLQKFCDGQFREHLFGNWPKNGLGLKESFANKYFIFKRLR